MLTVPLLAQALSFERSHPRTQRTITSRSKCRTREHPVQILQFAPGEPWSPAASCAMHCVSDPDVLMPRRHIVQLDDVFSIIV